MVEMKKSRNLPIYVLSGALIFAGIASIPQAQAAWTSKETSQVKTLERKIQKLEKQIGNLQESVYDVEELSERITSVENTYGLSSLITIRFLATDSSLGTFGEICPGDNFDYGGGYGALMGKLTPKTNIFGIAETNAAGQPITRNVYACKMSFYAKKSN